MSLPKKLSTGVRYLSSSAFNCSISFTDPNQGQATDGSPNAPVTVMQNVHANVSPWRGKEVDKPEERLGQSSYKIVIRHPKNYTVNTGMQIQLRNQLHEIESVYDPDGQQVELHIWTWVNNDVAGAS